MKPQDPHHLQQIHHKLENPEKINKREEVLRSKRKSPSVNCNTRMDSFMDNHNTNRHFNQPENSRLCKSGCGFLGLEANRGFCSRCYEDYLRLQIAKSKTVFCQTPVVSESEPNINHITSQDMVSLTDAMKSCTISSKNRCECCNKKVGLLGFGCRCGRTFCGIHRYPELHACKFDYKIAGRVALAKENPFCRGNKIRDRF